MFNTVNLDLGFSWIKAEKKGVIYRQPSIMGEAKDMFEQNIEPNHFIYNEEMYVGDIALKYSDIKYFSLNNNKAEAETSDILLKTALGYLARREKVTLVTGLPPHKDKSDIVREALRLFFFGVHSAPNNFVQVSENHTILEDKEFIVEEVEQIINEQDYEDRFDELLNSFG
ncbi:hypothetical protein AV545_02110 [Paenibacillus jamilae]|uniref:ParM/StbA family protein n=1 Tax=Paenibacillus jamilae TaxID=114136 RepID=UPI0007AB6555|nr:hypothetical protein [Paenibacillus jamilae]KZE68565.1 hypothetical protein AV545_02110 [Paenibacillus jamilae]